VEAISFDIRILIALLNRDVVRIAFQGCSQYLASLLLRTSSAMCEVLQFNLTKVCHRYSFPFMEEQIVALDSNCNHTACLAASLTPLVVYTYVTDISGLSEPIGIMDYLQIFNPDFI
jgi:hypothetical protein